MLAGGRWWTQAREYINWQWSTFWRTFHHDGIFGPAWRGWGYTPSPFHAIYPFNSSCFGPSTPSPAKLGREGYMYIIVHCTILSLLAILESTESLMVKILIVWGLFFSCCRAVAGSDTDVDAIYPGEIYLHMVKHEMLLLSPCLSFRTEFRAQICKHLRNSGNRFQGIDSASLVGRYAITRHTRLHRLAELIPWNRFLDSLNVYKFGLRAKWGEV